MLTWEDVKEAELGRTFDIKALKDCCKEVYGGVSWPGKRPGFAVVVGMDPKKHLDSHDVVILDEFESFDMRQLVRQCGVLDFKYLPGQWIGDWKNDAANKFLSEMNDEPKDGNRRSERQLDLGLTPMFDMEQLYPYILAEIRRLLAPDHRQLSLKDSKVRGYLSEIEGSDIADLERGAYPSIEALAFAVIEMRRWAEAENDDSACLFVPNPFGI